KGEVEVRRVGVAGLPKVQGSKAAVIGNIGQPQPPGILGHPFLAQLETKLCEVLIARDPECVLKPDGPMPLSAKISYRSPGTGRSKSFSAARELLLGHAALDSDGRREYFEC